MLAAFIGGWEVVLLVLVAAILFVALKIKEEL